MHDVADQLAESAPRFARDSLAALSTGDVVGFALYAATSLEHLLKCYLARMHPALIVDATNFDSLLHACGQDAVAKTPRDKIKTISAAEALRRAGRFMPLTSHSGSLDELFGVRNGAVHLADKAAVEPFVLPFLKASEQLREALALDRDAYWGEYISLADSTLREHVAAVELKVTAAIAAAKAVFAERFGPLDEATRTAVIAAYEPKSFYGDEEQETKCPACGSSALASGTVETEWLSIHRGDDDIPILDATFLPESLKCAVCGLVLDDYDELHAADAGDSWKIDVDAAAYFAEPDEDYWRDR